MYEFPYHLLPLPIELSYYDQRTRQIFRVEIVSHMNLVGIMARFNEKELNDLHDLFTKLIEQSQKEN